MALSADDRPGGGEQNDWLDPAPQEVPERTVDNTIEVWGSITPAYPAQVVSPSLAVAPETRQPSDRPGVQPYVLSSLLFAARVSVVIPVLNEEENLPHVLPWIPPWVHEVLLVDGKSVDNSVEVARRLRPDIRVVTQPGKGKGDALRAGFAAATGDIIVMLDADGSTNPLEIPAFVGALLAGADYAKGSRFMQGGGTADMSVTRRFGNDILLRLVRLAFGCAFSDLCYGYNAFWRHVLPVLNLDADGFEIETLMNVRAVRARLRVVEVHSFEGRRLHGESRLRAIPDGLRVLKTIIQERFAPSIKNTVSGRLDGRSALANRAVASQYDRESSRRAA